MDGFSRGALRGSSFSKIVVYMCMGFLVFRVGVLRASVFIVFFGSGGF